MPAYLMTLYPRQCQRCSKPARVELFNAVNASNGYFCVRHGGEELRKLNASTV